VLIEWGGAPITGKGRRRETSERFAAIETVGIGERGNTNGKGTTQGPRRLKERNRTIQMRYRQQSNFPGRLRNHPLEEGLERVKEVEEKDQAFAI